MTFFLKPRKPLTALASYVSDVAGVAWLVTLLALACGMDEGCANCCDSLAQLVMTTAKHKSLAMSSSYKVT